MFVLGGMIICTGRRRKITLGKIELLLAEVKRNKDEDLSAFPFAVNCIFFRLSQRHFA